VPASLPYPPQDQHRNDEFGYVQRRVRKTSVDERKVRCPRPLLKPLLTIMPGPPQATG
jgi:GATA-binding protein